MARPPLSAEDRAAWARLIATTRPLAAPPGQLAPTMVPPLPAIAKTPPRPPQPSHPTNVPAPISRAADTLDGGWDRRLRRGIAQPDRTIDLHGHSLATAHAALEGSLAEAVASGARLLLVITGKPPRGGERRGQIRASVADWLAVSRHGGRIAAVRNAHPRHGGAGALYVILRRTRAG